jgi:hypothetical protein
MNTESLYVKRQKTGLYNCSPTQVETTVLDILSHVEQCPISDIDLHEIYTIYKGFL